MQIKMLAYQSLDLFDEKQKLRGTSRAPASSTATMQGSTHSESTYLGQILETWVSQYQLDLYGFVTNTNYKYLIIKNETKTS